MIIDPNWYDYATDRQRECMELVEALGGLRPAAERLGIHHSAVGRAIQSVKAKAARSGYAPGHFEHGTAPGYRMGKVTVQRGATGEVERVWERQSPDEARWREQFTDWISGLVEPIKGLSPIVPAPQSCEADLLAVYPIGDHHYGMRADGNETGDSYDCKIARHRLISAVDRLVDSAPPAREALLINLGDYFHANDSRDTTPESGNRLDVDSRFGQVLYQGGQLLIDCVLRLLERHHTVRVWNMRGNHDPDAAMALAMAVAFYFHNQPRVIVDMGPSLYKYHRHGKNLIASHHGHGAKPDQLPLLMAVDRPADWAATTHRVWHCGHIHHKTFKEHPGVDVESHRTLAGSDAWHAGKGYRSKRDMSVIIYHAELGEQQRNRFDLASLAA